MQKGTNKQVESAISERRELHSPLKSRSSYKISPGSRKFQVRSRPRVGRSVSTRLDQITAGSRRVYACGSARGEWWVRFAIRPSYSVPSQIPSRHYQTITLVIIITIIRQWLSLCCETGPRARTNNKTINTANTDDGAPVRSMTTMASRGRGRGILINDAAPGACVRAKGGRRPRDGRRNDVIMTLTRRRRRHR